MIKVKICGITNLEDAVKACGYGADLLGFIFVEGTPRAVGMDTVKNIITDLPRGGESKVGRVGLFKDETIKNIIETISYCGLDYVQLHGDESLDYCRELKKALEEKICVQVKIIKAFKVKKKILPHGDAVPDDYADMDYFVFDAFHPVISGGTGTKFDWEVLKKEKYKIQKPFFIAGGLHPGNVADAVEIVRPYGVDVSSGVEKTPGKKDHKLLKEFIENAKKE